ncbi:peptide ABC transporter permease [Acrocarpospora pleiomorpha]|uniref:Peptide ABC transporter permease n=1 Tax=Acrocarpospora pleiomorpha TaxID=90975 RepID=A0A5M3XW08_9ACTN|nr:ABC transporter permease [Acrocarpospora pleiomorpha]GES25364.1 peptide ABC transporter permease [Acrocarpospora pleiomorpha]
MTDNRERTMRLRAGSRLLRLLASLTWILLVVWVAVSVTFVLSRIVPADPARLAAGLDAGPEQVAEVRAEMGLDQPLAAQYGRYLGDLITGDLGRSLQTRQPVIDDLLTALPASLELILASYLIYAVIGILAGIAWAYWPRGPHTLLLRFGAVIGVAVPVFWVGLVLQVVFAGKLQWFPVAGNFDFEGTGVPKVTGMGLVDTALTGQLPLIGEALRTLALPVVTLVVTHLAVTMTLMRSSLEEQLKRPYVRTARARGVKERRIVFVDALRNSLNPVVTMLGLQLGWSLGGVVIVEVIFSWPGFGLYAYQAFSAFDYNAIMAITLLSTVVFVTVNALVGMIYPMLDPRLKEAR